MSKKTKLVASIVVAVIVAIVLLIAALQPSEETINNSGSKSPSQNGLLNLVKGNSEPKLKIIERLDLTRFDVNGKPLRDDEYLWADKEYKEEGDKAIWTYTYKGIVGKLISSDKKDIDEFSYTFDIDVDNEVVRNDIIINIGYFNTALKQVYKIELSDINSNEYAELYSISSNYDKDLIPQPETKYTLNGLYEGKKQIWNCVFKYNKNSLIKQVAEDSGQKFTEEKLKEASMDSITCKT